MKKIMFSPKPDKQTDTQTDISNYKVASLLKMGSTQKIFLYGLFYGFQAKSKFKAGDMSGSLKTKMQKSKMFKMDVRTFQYWSQSCFAFHGVANC